MALLIALGGHFAIALGGVPVPVQAADTAASIGVSVAIVSPAGGAVTVNKQLSLNITVSNTGDETFTTIPLRAEFDISCLSYVSATQTPQIDPVNSRLVWNSLLSGGATLAPNDSLTLNLVLLATDSCGVENVAKTINAVVEGAATAEGGTAPTASNSATAIISFGLAATKQLTPPATVAPNDQVIFEITIANQSGQEFRNLELTDSYDGSRLQFVSATPAPIVSEGNELQWGDSLPNLQPDTSTTIQIVFRALNVAGRTTNTATVRAEGKVPGQSATAQAGASVTIVVATPPPPVPIPEPTTLILFGTGLAALSASVLRRRRQG